VTGLKLKSVYIFPSRVSGGLALDVEKTNGNYTIAVDYANLPIINPYTPVDTDYVLIWDNLANSYFLVPAISLSTAASAAFLTDSSGIYLTDSNGSYLVGGP
jgi:hypothetical protein